jgi:hypothetical protein
MDNNETTTVEEPKVHTAAEMERLRDTNRQTLKTLDIVYTNIVGAFADAVDQGTMDLEQALEMLNAAGIPEHYFEHLSKVEVEVEFEITATVTYTETVRVKVDRAEMDDSDAILEAVYDNVSLDDIICDNGYSLNVTDTDVEILDTQEV